MILLRVSLFFIVLLLLPDWYIYKAYIRHQSNKLWKQLFGIPSASLLLVLLIFILFKDSIQQHHFGTYLIITLCIAVPKAVFALFSLLMREFQSAPHPASSRMDCSPACTGRLWLHIVRCSPGKRELQGTSGYLRFARSAGCFRRIPHSPVVRYPFGKLERQRPCPATGHRLMQCPASGSGGIHR